MALAAFGLFAGLILYSYIVYPILLGLLALLFGRKSRADEAHAPSVSILIPAFNEEAFIARKIENALALDYPRERIEILVVSESTDGTDAIVRRYEKEGVRLLPSAVRRGKVANLNRAVPESRGEILVFTDANAMIRPDALRKIVRHFADPRIAAVSGRLVYSNPDRAAAGHAEGIYWGMEQWIKLASSRLFCLPGANGSLFGVRRSRYRPIAEDRGDDFEIPIRCIIDGYGSILEPEAISVEGSTLRFLHEYRRKVRIINWMLRSALILTGEAVMRGRWWLVFQILSHKINRWAGAFWLVGLFVSNLLLLDRGPFFVATAAAQAGFYCVAVTLLIVDHAVRPLSGWLGLPVYFIVVNAASAAGIVTGLLGREVTWHRTR
jgi:cellulose synthase/poly-beta-1,6-N-acetylglucosamine synthase-like glycosyltransferase